MYLNVVTLIACVMLFQDVDCHLHTRKLKKHIRRQNPYPSQSLPSPYPPPPVPQQVPSAQATSTFNERNNFPANYFGSQSEYNGQPPGNEPKPLNLSSSSGNAEMYPNPPPIANAPNAMTSGSNVYPSRAQLRRRRKNVSDKTEKHRQNSKKLFKGSTRRKSVDRKKNYLEKVEDYFRKDKDTNATVIPLSQGVEIKAISKHGKEKINTTVNITSSTQKITAFDNTTEIEDMVEMDVEKDIEDDKGVNKGSEELRIVETERVKPVAAKKWNGLNLLKRKRKSYKKRFAVHRRSKRSPLDFKEAPRSNSVFNKMAHRFMSIVNKKKKVPDLRNFSRRQIISDYLKNDSRQRATTSTQTAKEPTYNKNEIEDFTKFFMKQMQRFINSEESKKNKAVHSQRSHIGSRKSNTKLSKTKVKYIIKNFEFIKQTNLILNLNLTSENMNNYVNKSRSIREKSNHVKEGLEVTSTSSKFTTEGQKLLTLLYTREANNSSFSTGLLFSVVIFLFLLFLWIAKGKLCKLTQMNSINAKERTYKFYHEGKNDELKGLLCSGIEKGHKDEFAYPQLEWQSETGEWLSDKEF